MYSNLIVIKHDILISFAFTIGILWYHIQTVFSIDAADENILLFDYYYLSLSYDAFSPLPLKKGLIWNSCWGQCIPVENG